MNAEALVFLSLLFMVSTQAKYEFTQNAKDCMAEAGTDEDTIRALVFTDTGKVEDNEITEKFLGCCLKDYITDANDLVVDDAFTGYVIESFKRRLDGRTKLAKLLAEDCIEHCKGLKGDTKGKTAVKIADCVMTRLEEYTKKD